MAVVPEERGRGREGLPVWPCYLSLMKRDNSLCFLLLLGELRCWRAVPVPGRGGVSVGRGGVAPEERKEKGTGQGMNQQSTVK